VLLSEQAAQKLGTGLDPKRKAPKPEAGEQA
jgi:hypothetical protein